MAKPPPSSAPHTFWVAVVSTDAEHRESLRDALDDPATPAQLALSIDCPFSAVSDVEMQEIRKATPELLVVDLEEDPHAGLEFIRTVLESGAASAVVATGRDLSQDLLLKALEAGVTEMLPKPLEKEAVHTAVERVLRRAGRISRPSGEEEAGRVIALLGAKGGVGTTVLATNLAVEIRRLTGKRTLLLDLDVEQGETALLLGMDPQLSLLDLLRNYQPEVSGLLASCIDRHAASGLDLLAAPVQPSPVQQADLDLLSGERMREVMGFLREHYDYIVIDRPRSFHPAFSQVIEDADETFLITTPDLQALRNIARSMPLLRRMSESSEDGTFHLVVNRYPARPAISLDEIEETVGLDVYHSLAADFFSLNESAHERTPAVMREATQYAGGVRALATKITGPDAGGDGAGERRGFLGGLIGAVRNR